MTSNYRYTFGASDPTPADLARILEAQQGYLQQVDAVAERRHQKLIYTVLAGVAMVGSIVISSEPGRTWTSWLLAGGLLVLAVFLVLRSSSFDTKPLGPPPSALRDPTPPAGLGRYHPAEREPDPETTPITRPTNPPPVNDSRVQAPRVPMSARHHGGALKPEERNT